MFWRRDLNETDEEAGGRKFMRAAKMADKRSETVKFYLSEGEARMLKRQARNHCLSVPAYVRGLIRQEGGLVGRGHGFKREQDLP